MPPDPHQVAELFFAHAKVRSAALQIADAADRCRSQKQPIPELDRLACELMTMASVTEIVAYAMKDRSSAE